MGAVREEEVGIDDNWERRRIDRLILDSNIKRIPRDGCFSVIAIITCDILAVL